MSRYLGVRMLLTARAGYSQESAIDAYSIVILSKIAQRK